MRVRFVPSRFWKNELGKICYYYWASFNLILNRKVIPSILFRFYLVVGETALFHKECQLNQRERKNALRQSPPAGAWAELNKTIWGFKGPPSLHLSEKSIVAPNEKAVNRRAARALDFTSPNLLKFISLHFRRSEYEAIFYRTASLDLRFTGSLEISFAPRQTLLEGRWLAE